MTVVAAALSVSPAKLAETTPVCVPGLADELTPVRVATPLLLVVAVPTDVPFNSNVTVSPEIPALVAELTSVAVSVAVPPTTAVPPTLVNVVATWLTTRLPVTVVAAAFAVLPASCG